jgi:phospholipase D1/2
MVLSPGIYQQVDDAARQPISRGGRNCWRIAHADRVAFLIDGADYFAAFAAAAERAQESIFIVGWDVDSRVCLGPDGMNGELPGELGGFLNALVSRRQRLRVYILGWDFAIIYALEREPFPSFNPRWRSHRRIHFSLDGMHPGGASHHQKIVVVDDAIAFVGGIDMAIRRWDTPEHCAHDPRRVDPRGQPYPPVHDVQMAVDGEAATALAALVRERWQRATGGRWRSRQRGRGDPWPPGLMPDLRDVEVAIARTQPAYNSYPEVREVEALHLDAIAAARRSIYIEAQYFTSTVIAEALRQRLLEPGGPEVILVLPRVASGWLEQTTMGVLRARLLKQLQGADRFGRLRVYYPVVPDLDHRSINVHSKVLVVDDALVRIGSSNLANRSMGLDTECDLTIEAAGKTRIARAIARFRDRLLGEHLGVPPEMVAGMAAAKASLIAAVEELRSGGRTLEPWRDEVPRWLDQVIPDGDLVDPARPLDAKRVLEHYIPEDERRFGGRRLMRSVIFLLILVGLAAAWRWTPLATWLDVDAVADWATALQSNPIAPLVVIGAHIVAGLVLVPVTFLITVSAMAFGPWLGITYWLFGCLGSAMLTFAIGRLPGHDTVRSIAGSRIDRLSRRLARHGLLGVLTVRVLPVAPFTIVNIVAGASHIRVRDFALGTLLGMLPGILPLTLFGVI